MLFKELFDCLHGFVANVLLWCWKVRREGSVTALSYTPSLVLLLLVTYKPLFESNWTEFEADTNDIFVSLVMLDMMFHEINFETRVLMIASLSSSKLSHYENCNNLTQECQLWLMHPPSIEGSSSWSTDGQDLTWNVHSSFDQQRHFRFRLLPAEPCLSEGCTCTSDSDCPGDNGRCVACNCMSCPVSVGDDIINPPLTFVIDTTRSVLVRVLAVSRKWISASIIIGWYSH